jgi:ribosome-binding protein aMBF1 (putative translation factor)
MSVRMKVHPTKNCVYKVVIEMPNRETVSSSISEEDFPKLQAFLEKHDASESVVWEELARDRLARYKASGLALRGARYREGLSQKELARRSGVSQENISRMENGHRPVGDKVAKKLAKVLRIDPALLIAA